MIDLVNVIQNRRFEEFKRKFNLVDKYPIRDLSRWHTLLCFSCPQGKKEFAEKHNLDIENGTLTIPEFIELVQDAHGSKQIQKLKTILGIDDKND
jgi:hypothetical protein